jgi:hypothetical protein
MAFIIPIKDRSRKFGYIYWTKSLDTSAERFFAGRKVVDVVFQGTSIGEKKVDRKNRRVSIGLAKTRVLDESLTHYRLRFIKDGRLQITCQ